MTSRDRLDNGASALVDAAHVFRRAAATPGSYAATPESLASIQQALQLLSAAWYRLAADAGAERDHARDLSREQEVRLIGALQDVAAAFARCARASREAKQAVGPIIARNRTEQAA
jgi:hypothetical protein